MGGGGGEEKRKARIPLNIIDGGVGGDQNARGGSLYESSKYTSAPHVHDTRVLGFCKDKHVLYTYIYILYVYVYIPNMYMTHTTIIT